MVGSAIAREVSKNWNDVFLLEALPKLGMGASSRNSGVIHSGLYYPPESLKARLCVRGNRLTYEFCAAHHVPHKNIGKLVVAVSPEETQKLAVLVQNGISNGVEGMRIVDEATIRAREPHVRGFQAIDVPSTGILSSEDLVKAYARVAADQGAHIVTRARVERLEVSPRGIHVTSAAGEIEARCVINSTGLFADEIAGMLGSKMAQHRIYPVRGEYCELVRSKQDWIRGLVYPLPHPEGMSLGLHLTKTLAGNVLLGPTARYVEDKSDYDHSRIPIEEFAEGAKHLLPDIRPEDLVMAYSGIRAKLVPPSKTSASSPERKGIADFIVERDQEYPAVIHLMGIESPGLTSAPAIAEYVEKMVAETLN